MIKEIDIVKEIKKGHVNKVDYPDCIYFDETSLTSRLFNNAYNPAKVPEHCYAKWYGLYEGKICSKLRALIYVKSYTNIKLDIQLLEVHKDYRHKGYGTQLVKHIIDKYKDKYEVIELRPMTHSLNKFYEQLGFKELKPRSNIMQFKGEKLNG